MSERLRAAVHAAGGSYLVCLTDAGIECLPTIATRSPRDYRDFTYGVSDAEWSALPASTARPGHLVVAAVLGGVAAPAFLIRLDADGGTFIDGVSGVSPPDEGGVSYFDLGTVTPGRYLLAIGAVQNDPSGGFRGSTYLIALRVSS